MATDQSRNEAAKQEILRRIHAANAAAGKPETAYPVPRRYVQKSPADAAGLRSEFIDRLTDYGVTVAAAKPDGVAEAIAQLVDVLGISVGGGRAAEETTARIVYAPGLDPRLFGPLEQRGFSVAADDASTDPRTLDTASAVVTGSTVSCSQTGTICLESGPLGGRRALSLVPDIHLCLVEETSIVGTVPEMMAQLSQTAPVTMISGPSATSDIELERVNGVHGPRTLGVILIAAAPGGDGQ